MTPHKLPNNDEILIVPIPEDADLNWIDRKTKLPRYGEVEVSCNGGKTSEGSAQFSENCTCMMAGIAGGNGYFRDEFATIDDNLILHDVTHWRELYFDDDTIELIKTSSILGKFSAEDITVDFEVKEEWVEREDDSMEFNFYKNHLQNHHPIFDMDTPKESFISLLQHLISESKLSSQVYLIILIGGK